MKRKVKILVGDCTDDELLTLIKCLELHKKAYSIDCYELYVSSIKKEISNICNGKAWIIERRIPEFLLHIKMKNAYMFGVPGTIIFEFSEKRFDYSKNIIGNNGVTLEELVKYGVLDIPRY